RAVVAVLRGEPRLPRQAWAIHRVERDALGFHPDAELQAGAMRFLGERRETVRKPNRILRPRAEPALEVVIAKDARTDIPTRVDDEELDAHGGGAPHLVG